MGVKIQAILFDCFGVLITDGLEAVNQRLAKSDPEARAFVTDTIKQNNRGLLQPAESNRLIAERLGIPVDEWVRMVSVGEVKNDELLGWLPELRQHYKVGLLSNIGQGSLERRFTDDELRRSFDVLIISGDVGSIKPEPEIYQKAAKKLAVPLPACVFFDDRQIHVQGAIDAGMRGILFQSVAQAKADLQKIVDAQ